MKTNTAKAPSGDQSTSEAPMHTPRQGHTPGPWTAQPTHGNGWGVFATPLQFNVLDNSAPEPINAEANARLIAAAPALLAALEECSKLLDAVINNGKCAAFADITQGEMGNILDPAAAARVAITKAKGGAL